MSAQSTTYTWEREDGEEVRIEIEFSCSRYDPGCVSGPPEGCYPPEGGEVEEIEFFAGEGCTEEALKAFEAEYNEGGSLQEKVDEQCSLQAIEGYYDYDGPDYY